MAKISNARNTTTKPHASHILNDRALFVSFIFTDTNIQMIKNHPRLSVIISFIFTDKNNRKIENHLRFAITEKIIRKACPMLLHSVYSIILLYILRYTRAHSYIKSRQ